MTLEESKLEILRRVEQGTLSIEEGAHLLEILDGNLKGTAVRVEPAVESEPAGAVNAVFQPHSSMEPVTVPSLWRAAWGILLWLGVIFLGLSGFWLYSSYNHSGLGVGFWFALFFVMLSCLIVFLGWQLIDSRWVAVHIRSHEDKGDKKFTVWAPLPIRFAKWIFQTFGVYMPEKVQAKNIVDILDEMEGSGDGEEPFVIEIDGEKGAQTTVNFDNEKGTKAKFNIEF
jgi:hypothetical protein